MAELVRVGLAFRVDEATEDEGMSASRHLRLVEATEGGLLSPMTQRAVATDEPAATSVRRYADRLWDLVDAADDADDPMRRGLLRRALHVAALAGHPIDPIGRDDDHVHNELAWVAQGLELEAHFEAHPDLRPSLAEVTIAFAQQRCSPLADQPDAIAAAVAKAQELYGDDATARDAFSIATGVAAA